MKSKTRLLITITAVVLAMIASVVAVVAVFAARRATVSSNVTVKYVATDIMADISCHTKRELESDWKNDEFTSEGKVSFTGGEADDVNQSIALDGDYEISELGSVYVTLRFTFKNNNEARAFTAIPTIYNHDTNGYISVSYAIGTDENAPADASFKIDDKDPATEYLQGDTLTIAKKSGADPSLYTKYYYIRITVTSTGRTQQEITNNIDITWNLAAATAA